MVFGQPNTEVTRFLILFFFIFSQIYQAGVCHWAVWAWDDWYRPCGCGSEWCGDFQGQLLLLSEYSSDTLPPADLCFLLRLSLHILLLRSLTLHHPLGKPSQVSLLSVNRWVLWFRRMRVCGNLQTFISAATKRHWHSALTTSNNKYADCWNVALLWIHQWSGWTGQHCVNEPQPTHFPIGFEAFSQWKYPHKPSFLFVYRQRVFHNSILEPSIISVALPVNHPSEKSPQSQSPFWYIRMNKIQNNKQCALLLRELLSSFPIRPRDAQCERSIHCRTSRGSCGRKRIADRICACTASPSSDLWTETSASLHPLGHTMGLLLPLCSEEVNSVSEDKRFPRRQGSRQG